MLRPAAGLPALFRAASLPCRHNDLLPAIQASRSGVTSSFTTSALSRLKQMPPRPKPPPESEIEESFLKGSGPGGQKINKTNSAVQLKHLPTGIVVKSQATRSRSQNRKIARELLAARLDELRNGAASRAAVVSETKRKRAASRAKKARRKYRRLAGEAEAEVEDEDDDERGEIEAEGDKDKRGQKEKDRGERRQRAVAHASGAKGGVEEAVREYEEQEEDEEGDEEEEEEWEEEEEDDDDEDDEYDDDNEEDAGVRKRRDKAQDGLPSPREEKAVKSTTTARAHRGRNNHPLNEN